MVPLFRQSLPAHTSRGLRTCGSGRGATRRLNIGARGRVERAQGQSAKGAMRLWLPGEPDAVRPVTAVGGTHELAVNEVVLCVMKGKRHKMRPQSIVAALTKDAGVPAGLIGRIRRIGIADVTRSFEGDQCLQRPVPAPCVRAGSCITPVTHLGREE